MEISSVYASFHGSYVLRLTNLSIAFARGWTLQAVLVLPDHIFKRPRSAIRSPVAALGRDRIIQEVSLASYFTMEYSANGLGSCSMFSFTAIKNL